MRLVLEGGGVRAAYQAGLLEVLEQAAMPVEAVVGSSSGSINAAFFSAGQASTAVELWRDYVPSARFISWRRQFTPWGAPGLGVDDMLDNVIQAGGLLDRERATTGDPALFLTVTDVDAHEGAVVRPKASDLFDWLRAALALPVGYNRVVTVQGRRCIDGGIGAPVCFEEDLGLETKGPTVVVLTRPMQTQKPPPVLWERMAVRTIVPAPARHMCLSQHDLHNDTMRRLENAKARGDVLVVEPPDDLPLSRLTRDPARVRRGIELGWRRGEQLLRELEKLGSRLD